jgi:hypothetical protein
MFEESILKLLNKFASAGPAGIDAALRIARQLVFFRPDPREKEKKELRKRNPRDWAASLDPSPPYEDWQYAHVLDRGIRPLVVAAPLPTALLLIEAVANMLVLDTGRSPDAVDHPRNDASEIWSPRVDAKVEAYPNPKADLVRILTFACEQVFTKGDATEIEKLDDSLRNAKWYLFERIRYHLYAQHLGRAKSWIQSSILSHREYGAAQYGFEFQRLVRMAAEHFGPSLAAKSDLEKIFEEILNGPDKDDYQRFMAERFSEEAYRRRQQYFQRRQFAPFATVLFGKYKERYEQLVANGAPTDDDFVRYDGGESKTGASRSPKALAELAALSDDELIAFLNSWEDTHRDEKEWWVDIDFDGLATAIKQLISADPNRFLNWGQRWHTIERPIYLRYALDVATKRVGEHQSELEQWLNLADWIMAQSERIPESDQKNSETSRTHPDWSGARTQVVDLVGACMKKEMNVNLQWRQRFFQLLKVASVAPDYYLDADKPIITPRDYLTDAINTMRGRALEYLLAYGFWVRRKDKEADLSELFQAFEARFRGTPALAAAEYALLGASFHQLFGLNASWSTENAAQVFPQGQPSRWSVGFAAYLKFNNAHPLVFEIFKPHFAFALNHLALLKEEKRSRGDSIAHLGYHLVAYLIQGFFDESKGNLLQTYYEKTEPEYWADVFDHTGRVLSNSPTLAPDFRERAKAFFEMRLVAANPDELVECTFWLKAECLEPTWRLRAFLRTLDVSNKGGPLISIDIRELAKLVDAEPDLVLACFAKMTEGLVGRPYFYLRPEEVKPILKRGLASDNERTAEAAKFAQDNLLRAGRSEYRNLDAIKDETNWNE